MPNEALQRWRRAVGLLNIGTRNYPSKFVDPRSEDETGLHPEVLASLRGRDPQMIGEFQSYTYGAARRQNEASVGTTGENLHGKYIYVLSPFGKLYVHPEPAGVGGLRTDEFRHSAFLAGRPVLSAGQMYIWEGDLLLIDNSSGHYRPKPATMKHILAWLRKHGIALEGVAVNLYSEEGVALVEASDFMLRGVHATALPSKDLPDVEAVFGFVDQQKLLGKTFSSFREAAKAQADSRAAIQKSGAERAGLARAAAEKKKKEQAELERQREQREKERAAKMAEKAAERERQRQAFLAAKKRGPQAASSSQDTL